MLLARALATRCEKQKQRQTFARDITSRTVGKVDYPYGFCVYGIIKVWIETI